MLHAMSILRITLATLALAACARTSVPSPTVTADDAAAASGTPDAAASGTPDAAAPLANAAASARGSCTARSELTSTSGEKISCYP